MVFPGGRSPYLILKELREREIPWKALHLYPSDERCVPVGDPDRNDRLIDELIIGHVPFPEKNFHRIPAELGSEEGSLQYALLLDRTPRFDIALLGVGSDGHTASLFPGHPALLNRRPAVPVENAPKEPSSRISIGLKRLAEALVRQVIVIGKDKLSLLAFPDVFENSPIGQVQPDVLHVCKDRADVLPYDRGNILKNYC